MYWADKFADHIIKSGQHKPYWVDDMKTPSGKVHIGSVRAIVTHDLIYKALKDRGVDATFSYVLEDHDPMDGIPVYLDQEKYKQHLGKPLYHVPSPKPGFKSYGHFWGSEYIDIFNQIGAHPQVIWGSQLYLSGKMNDMVKLCLDSAAKIRHIYKVMYKQDKPANWYPFNVICESCGKMSTTKVTKWDGKLVTYECKPDAVTWTQGCGHHGKISPFNGRGKLPWKVEWGCKWKVVGITVEGAGKDHMTAGGSHDFAKLVCEQVINFPVPFHFSHEFLLIGGRKMSSSKGVGSSAKEVSEILPAELIRFMISRVPYNRAINFDPGGMTIPDLYDSYDEAALAYWDKGEQQLARIYELSQIDRQPPQKHFLPRFRDVANFIQYPEIDLYQKFREVKGSELTNDEKDVLEDRVRYAQIWLDGYAPPDAVFTPTKDIPESAKNLNSEQKTYLGQVIELLNQEWKEPEELQQTLYQTAKDMGLHPKNAFAAIYLSLIGKNHGPRAAWLLLEHLQLAISRFQQITADNHPQKERAVQSAATDKLTIDSGLAAKYPSVNIGYAIIEGVNITKTNPELEEEKQELLESLAGLTTKQLGEYPEVKSYRRLYKDMGIDWHSRRPSPEALLRRVALNKGLYSINTCVDAYNLIVMKYRVSAGAFNADNLHFPSLIKIAQGGEKIHLLGDDEDTTLKAGEIAYFDQQGPYNLDYNYRDAQRTMVTETTKNLWINIDGVYDITPNKVQKTLDETISIIQKYCGGKVVEKGILTAN